MPIEKLEEFARNGQKNTDELVLTDGFPRPKFPARQWFNYLFNMLSLKINELIELDPIARNEIVDNLTTNDATKVASARTVKELQNNKLEKTDLKDATTGQKGIVQLVDNLTTGGGDKGLTAEMGKALLEMFSSSITENGWQKIANPSNHSQPLIIQWGKFNSSTTQNKTTVNFPISFTNSCLFAIANDCNNGVNFTGYLATKTTATFTTANAQQVGAGSPYTFLAIGY